LNFPSQWYLRETKREKKLGLGFGLRTRLDEGGWAFTVESRGGVFQHFR